MRSVPLRCAALACQVVGAAHNYDVPMIIADAPGVPAGAGYWKGIISPAANAAALAESLAGSRLVACAQECCAPAAGMRGDPRAVALGIGCAALIARMRAGVRRSVLTAQSR